jgi:hypothetical protein
MSDNQATVNISNIQRERISRAQGCLIGQLVGDALELAAQLVAA